MTNRIRSPREIRQLLAAIVEHPDLVGQPGDGLKRGYSDVLDEVIPDEVTPDAVINWDMVYIHAVDDDVHHRIKRLAGDNVPRHQVVRHYLNGWMEEQGIDEEELREYV